MAGAFGVQVAIIGFLTIASYILLAIGILWLRDRITRPARRAPAEVAAARTAHIEALKRPRWADIEAAMRRPIPPVLKDLYANPALLTGEDLYIFDPGKPQTEGDAWWIALSPASLECLHPDIASIPPNAFAFATNEYGDPYYVQLSSDSDGDGPVSIHYHDGGDTERVAPSLRTFLSWSSTPVFSFRPAT